MTILEMIVFFENELNLEIKGEDLSVCTTIDDIYKLTKIKKVTQTNFGWLVQVGFVLVGFKENQRKNRAKTKNKPIVGTHFDQF